MKRIIDEIITPEMQDIKVRIAQTVAQRNTLKSEMQSWYVTNPKKHFPYMNKLTLLDAKLSELDTSYKKLWDINNYN